MKNFPFGVKNNIWTIAIVNTKDKKIEEDLHKMHYMFVCGESNSYVIANPNLKYLEYLFGPKRYNLESFIFIELKDDFIYNTYRQKGNKFYKDECSLSMDNLYSKLSLVIDNLSNKLENLLSWNNNYVNILKESSLGFLNKTLKSMWTYNCENIISLEEYNRRQEIKE